MAQLIEAVRFAAEVELDLQDFAAYLQRVHFPHRLAEAQGEMVLWVYAPEHVAVAQALFQRFLAGERDAHLDILQPTAPSYQQVLLSLLARPLTLLTLLLALLGFVIVQVEWLSLLSLLSFQSFTVSSDALVFASKATAWGAIGSGEIWRLLTPIFLHFGWMHLGFNVVLFWFFAQQVEQQEGALRLLSHIVVLAVVSNLAQFYAADEGQLFGGLSGVVYGLMGYCWLSNQLAPPRFYLPSGLFWVSVVMILLGFANVFSLFGLSIANWAHLAGLLMGLLWAVLQRMLYRPRIVIERGDDNGL